MHQTHLEIIEIPISQGQYIADLKEFCLGGLPHRVIFNKLLPGCGATTKEIISDYNMITVEPYRPVIEGKEAKYKEIRGVYKGVYEDKILAYIEKRNGKPLKFMVTPEAYKRLFSILSQYYDVYKEFRIVIDECDRLVSDVDFRTSITMPIDDFFKYESNIFISATPIIPSDKRFKENGFKVLKLKPNFDYRHHIDLIHTNSVLTSLRARLKEKPEVPFFIFINSTDTIHALIKSLNIVKDSRVFCSDKSVKKLKGEGFRTAYAKLGNFADFNFLTSRFFPAVDIDLDIKPNVIMLTELYFAEHTMLDPFTDSIQIAGRFRNGVNNITHITNSNSYLTYMSRAEAKAHLKGSHEVYTQLLGLYHSVADKGKKDVFKQACERVDFFRFVTEDNKLNSFMVDNFIHDEKVKEYYTDPQKLKKAYQNTNYFIVNFIQEMFLLGDIDKLKRTRASQKNQKEYYQELASQLNKLLSPTPFGVFQLGRPEKAIQEIKDECPLIYEAVKTIGIKGLEEAGWITGKIKKAVSGKNRDNIINNFEMIDVIYSKIPANKPCLDTLTVGALQEIYNEYGINEKARPSHITRYFHTQRTTIQGKKAYNIGRRKFIWSNE